MWEAEAREASVALRGFSEMDSSRVAYHIIYATEYLLTSEGAEIRTSRTLSAIEAGMETQAEDGMPVHTYYPTYAASPAALPTETQARHPLDNARQQLM